MNLTDKLTGKTPEAYCEQLIRAALVADTVPNVDAIADRCALEPRDVVLIRDRVLAGRKPMTDYRAPGRVAAPAPQPTAEAWRAGIDHPQVKIRRAAAKAVAAVQAVEALLADDAGKVKLREREAKLAAELAKVRAELKGDTAPVERVRCDCGDMVRADRIKQHALRSAKHAA
jgi:hypothetical protein